MEHPTADDAALDPEAVASPGPALAAVLPPPPAPREAARDTPALRRFRARWLALLAATAFALYVCWLMLVPFVEVLMWATVLAIVFYPVHLWIVRRTGRPGGGA